jgi:AcrR family transcriptional regulator
VKPADASAPTSPASGTDTAIIAAARDEFVRFGMRRANVGDIARRAGLSRVTVHRRFTSKAGLLRAVVMAEIARFVDDFDRVWYAPGPIAERVLNAFELSIRELRRNPLLTTLLVSEPEAVVPQLTIEGEPQFEMVRALLLIRVEEAIANGELSPFDTKRVIETILRIVYTAALLPYGDVPGQTTEDIRAFGEAVLLPILQINVR